MRPLLRAEARKLATVRSLPLLVASVVVVETVFKALLAGLQEVSGVDTRSEQISLLGPTLFLPLGAATVGVLLAGAEWRYRLAVGSFLVTPTRTPVLLAQAAVSALLGAALGLVAGAASVALAGVVIDGRTELQVGAGEGLGIVAGCVLGCALLAAGGVAVAALLRSQAVALGAVTVVLLVLAPLTLALAPGLSAVLPYGFVIGLALQQDAEPALLSPGPAGVVLALEIGLALIAAVRGLRRVDVG